MPHHIPILMYHSIAHDADPRFRRWTVAPEDFAAQLGFLAQNNYITLTVTQFVAARSGGSLPERPVILTFDDGFADFYSAALPLFKRHNMTATLYITTGYIGGASQWLASQGEGSRPMLNWQQINEIANSGIEIGAHTHTHPALDTIPLGQAQQEIAGPKALLEAQIGRRVESFAYPFGYYSRVEQHLVREAGYTSACAVRYEMSSRTDDVLALARHIVPRDMPLHEFGALLTGKSAFWPQYYLRLRSTIWQAVRHWKYRERAM